MPPEAKEPPDPVDRTAGLGLLFAALLVFGANWLMLRILGRYLPLILALAGPLVTLGALTLVHPRFFNAMIGARGTNEARWVANVAYGALGLGVTLSCSYSSEPTMELRERNDSVE